MKRITLLEAKELAYKKINVDLFSDNRPLILDQYTWDFDWGYVFLYNGKKAIEENNFIDYGYVGNSPILVDKLNGKTCFIGGIGYTIDAELEVYRKTQSYPFCIKKNLPKDFSKKTIIDQILTLFKTEEIFHVKKGIELIIQHNIIDIESLKAITFNPCWKEWSFEESIIHDFNNQSLYLGPIIGSTFPSNLDLFYDRTELTISMKLDVVPEQLLRLSNLKYIEFWDADINAITPKIAELKLLKEIVVYESSLGKQAKKVLEMLKANGVKIHISNNSNQQYIL